MHKITHWFCRTFSFITYGVSIFLSNSSLGQKKAAHTLRLTVFLGLGFILVLIWIRQMSFYSCFFCIVYIMSSRLHGINHKSKTEGVLAFPIWHLRLFTETCPKCEHPRAYFMQIQTRSADEPMTTFYKCCNAQCGHRWRDWALCTLDVFTLMPMWHILHPSYLLLHLCEYLLPTGSCNYGKAFDEFQCAVSAVCV